MTRLWTILALSLVILAATMPVANAAPLQATCIDAPVVVTFQVPEPNADEWVIPGVVAVVYRDEPRTLAGVVITSPDDRTEERVAVAATTGAAECVMLSLSCFTGWVRNLDPNPIQPQINIPDQCLPGVTLS